jgi:hypothetical protein
VFSVLQSQKVTQHERSKTNPHVLSKVQNSSNSHRKPLQGWKTQSLSQRRTAPQTREARLRRTKISASTRIRQNHQKTNPAPQMQKMQFHTPERWHTPQKACHHLKEAKNHDRMEQTHPQTQKPLPARQMPKMRKRTTALQQRHKQSHLQRLWRNAR